MSGCFLIPQPKMKGSISIIVLRRVCEKLFLKLACCIWNKNKLKMTLVCNFVIVFKTEIIIYWTIFTYERKSTRTKLLIDEIKVCASLTFQGC